ncbi:MAG TPA: class I SAM-dependent methyltransferase [Gallionella sp.]|nr:class I SAM-dependent methyltransferase [Gallionella sp.]HUW75087.1 class I SAM-dependent methyltransferase [Gallionella sp.]
MFWQKRFDEFVARMRVHDLPLHLNLWNGAVFELGQSPRVTVSIPYAKSLRHFFPPTLDSLGHAYVEGEIDVKGRLADIIEVAARLATHGKDHQRPGARMIRHTRKIDAEAIAYHYDVSNEFYALWLDSNMVYSCGYFHSAEDTLEAAQIQKIDHILTKLRIQPGDRLLDIGCGWGALVMRAAEKYGAKTLGITLSRNQYELAQERIAAAGLADRCEVRMEDCRDVVGKFDRITSVGMFEHVGLKHLRSYFAKVQELLADNGVVLNHGITSTSPDSAESPFGGGDFIERYVFPHGELPHIGLVLQEMCAAGLEPVDMENLRRHYALTLNHWVERYEAAGDRLRQIAGEKRWRIWRMYLAGCAHGFAHNWISIHQILAVKAGAAALPLTRNYMYKD